MVATNEKKRTHVVLKASEKKQIVNYSSRNSHLKQNEIAEHFSKLFCVRISRRSIYDILKRKEFWNDYEEDLKIINSQIAIPEVENALVMWIDQALENNLIITDEIIIDKAKKFGKEFNVSETFQYSSGWLYRFKSRHNIKQRVIHGEAASASLEEVELARNDLKRVLSDYSLNQIYNMDETALFYDLTPNKTLCTMAKKSGTKQSKKRITLSICCSADGLHKLPLTMIGHAKSPRCFKNFNCLAFVDYFNNTKAWMTTKIFNDWLAKFDQEMRRLNKSAALIIDNAPSHVCTITLTNTKLVFLPPNLTSVIQPLDAGIISSLKRCYKSKIVSHAVKCYDENLNSKIDLKFCVKTISKVWENMSFNTIKNCFAHCKIIEDLENVSQNNDNEIKKFEDKIKLFRDKSGDAVEEKEAYLNIESQHSTSIIIENIDEEIIKSLKNIDQNVYDDEDEHINENVKKNLSRKH